MKEFSTEVTKAFSNGLRPVAFKDRNLEWLTESKNALAEAEGLQRLWRKVPTFPEFTIDFPFPQIRFLRDFTLMATRAGIFEQQADGTWDQVVVLAREDHWDILDFGPYVLCANDGVVYARNVVSGVYEDISSTFTVADSVANFNGQLVAAGSYAGDAYVQWGKIGQVDFTVDRSNVSGYTLMIGVGKVHKVKTLGKGFVVYCDNSIEYFYAAPAPALTFGRTTFLTKGVNSKGAVAGDDKDHVVITNNGDLYEISDKGVEVKGFKEFLANDGITTITKDVSDNTYYIQVAYDGYVYKDGKLGRFEQMITSGDGLDGEFYFMADRTHDEEFRVTTTAFDFGIRGQKTLYAVECSIDTGVAVELAVYSRMDINGGFRKTKWVPLGKQGIATLPVTGTEFKISLRALAPGDLNLSALNIHWKLTDKRAIRGPYAGVK